MSTKNSERLRTILSHPVFANGFALTLLFLLPAYGTPLVMVLCALGFTIYIVALPEQFRDRNGSPKLATALAFGMWLLTILVTALALAGAAN